MKSLRALMGRSELSLLATLVFGALNFWPFVAFDSPRKVFLFLLGLWLTQVVFLTLRSALATDEPADAARGARD